MATGRVNIGGSGGGFNIYCQPNEPRNKEGIWIKNNAKIKKIVQDNEIWFANAFNDPAKIKFADVPNITALNGIAVNDVIYFPGASGASQTSQTRSFSKYDMKNNTWTTLPLLPESGHYHQGIAIGTDIYMTWINYNSGAYRNAFYKYNTITGEFTKLADGSYYSAGGKLLYISGLLYLIGGVIGNVDGDKTNIYKYDPDTNTWITVGKYPYAMSLFSKLHVVGSQIYNFGTNSTSQSPSYRNTCGKFNIQTLVYTKISDSGPIDMGDNYCKSVIVDDKVYFLSGNKIYTFSIGSELFSESPIIGIAMPTRFLYYKGAIHTFGFYTTDTALQYANRRLMFNSKVFDEGTAVILRYSDGGINGYYTELISVSLRIPGKYNRFVTGFDDLYLYLNGTLHERLETYYGDGKKWIKYKGA